MPISKDERRQTGILVSLYVYLTIFFLPIVDYYCDWFVSAIPVILVAFFVIRNRDYKIPVKFLVLFLLICANMLLFYWGMYRDAKLEWLISMELIPLLPFVFTYAMKDVKNPASFKNVLQYVAILLFITSVTSLIGYNVYPAASRELASGTAVYDTIPYVKANIGGYNFIYSLVLFIPIAIWLIKNTGYLAKVFNITALATYFFCIYQSKYTIALLFSIIALILFLFLYSKKSIAVIAVGALVMLLVFKDVIAYTLIRLSAHIEYQYMADRIMEVAGIISGQDISLATSDIRLELYQRAFAAFGSSPIFGHNLISFSKSVLSGHSTVIDMMAALGLAGLSVYVVLLLKLYSLSVAPLKSISNRYIIMVMVLFALISVFNVNYYSMFFVVAAVCTSCIHRYENRVKEAEAA